MKKIFLLLVGLLLGFTASAQATAVQLNTDGVAGYDLGQIEIFDWLTDSSLVIEQTLVGSSTGATTLDEFFGTFGTDYNTGDTLTFNIHAQSEVVAFIDTSSNTIYDGLGTDYNITGILDGVETATVIGEETIVFTGVTGSFEYYFDTVNDADVETGVGFDASATSIKFMEGDITSASGVFTGLVGTGSVTLESSITWYDKDYIDVDPNTDPSVVLIGASYTSQMNLESAPGTSGKDFINVGATIGGAGAWTPYEVLADDLRLAGDASSDFTAVPEPATMVLLGFGLLTIAGFTRKKS